jgi:hypothetical protein
MQQFFSYLQFILVKLQLLHCYLNIFFNTFLLNVWPYANEIRQPVCLRGTTQQLDLYFGYEFLVVLKLLFTQCIFQGTEKM